MAKNITLKDKSGNQLLPVTSAANVFMADSRTVESLVLDISNNAIKYELNTNTNDVNAQQTATFDSAGNTIVDTYATKEEIPISLPLGTIIPAAIPLSDSGVHLLDGSTITQTGIYSAFTTYLRNLQSTYSNLFCTETEWQNINTINGECGKFVINDSNNTIRLPKITHIIQGTVNLTTIGDSIAPGLPNITGAFYTDMKFNASNYTATGPFSTKTTSYSAFSSRSTESDSSITGFEFDASLSNELYGASNTVQPRTLLYPYYIVVANNISKKDVDFAKIATDLNGKISKAECIRYPIAKYISTDESTWYTIYSDGWKECGGRLVPGTSADGTTITLPTSFSSTNYFVTAVATRGTYQSVVNYQIINESQLLLRCGVQGSGYYNNTITWRCEGY